MNFFKSMASDLREAVEDHVEDAINTATKPAGKPTAAEPVAAEQVVAEKSFEERAEIAIPGMVRMISGCADTQTSADVSNTASFELPAEAGPGGAGGACTNAMISALSESDDRTWVQLLDAMRDILDTKGYEQIPQLSASRKLDIENDKFSVVNPAEVEGASRRAVLIGINYVGQRGELRGCHNDVEAMKRLIAKHGFEGDNVRVLMDDGAHTNPTGENIMTALDWLTDNAKAGDSLFLHYSGHGGYVTDESKDEKDGRDETLVPVDFQEHGQIIDDLVFKELVMPVPKGCQLTCVMDCCHSGTVLDLPYMIKASEHLEGSHASMTENPGFSFKKLLQVAQKLYSMHSQGASHQDLATTAAKELMPLFNGKNAQGGLGNLLSMVSGAKPGASGMPSLPF